ncbi:hypothetical protein BJ138DRAFT_981909, partial [Hygrophoropsis aurantiaca]
MLLWIKSALTPQEIRDRLMSADADFQRLLVEYLEGVHCGEFINSSMDQVRDRLDCTRVDEDLPTAVETMATPPICAADTDCTDMADCERCLLWKEQFINTVNELLFRCN